MSWLVLCLSALQAGLSFIGENGVTLNFLDLQLNMYTTPALLAAAFGLVNILLVLLVLKLVFCVNFKILQYIQFSLFI